MDNLRLKFFNSNLEKAKNKKDLNDWEKKFISDIEMWARNKNFEPSHKQYNTLKEIAEK